MKIYLHKLTSSHTTIRNSQFHWLLCVRSCTRVDKCGISSNRFLRNDSERDTQRESGKESSILLCEFHDVCRVNWMEWIDLIFVIQSDLNPLLLHHSSKWFSLHIKESILFLYFVCEHYFTYLGTTTSFSVIVIFLVDLLCVCVCACVLFARENISPSQNVLKAIRNDVNFLEFLLQMTFNVDWSIQNAMLYTFRIE